MARISSASVPIILIISKRFISTRLPPIHHKTRITLKIMAATAATAKQLQQLDDYLETMRLLTVSSVRFFATYLKANTLTFCLDRLRLFSNPGDGDRSYMIFAMDANEGDILSSAVFALH
ncbi:hypothetical protein K443DRAFT_15850 [Laccaria amethystina LaAM-08-1]|uniref:Uncharacterized protein n=1 Tax=Laccaria amethystina LaAM-08-1 TaxID=1095629 RepID=A0A0C9WKS8_9AGAR|nr:hypothetical protein K443DRAFT_15850 [Laccaria amethystina LaAM-08-1]